MHDRRLKKTGHTVHLYSDFVMGSILRIEIYSHARDCATMVYSANSLQRARDPRFPRSSRALDNEFMARGNAQRISLSALIFIFI